MRRSDATPDGRSRPISVKRRFASGTTTVPEWGLTLIGVFSGLVLLWLLLIVVLYIQQRRAGRDADWRSLARLAPDTVRLIRRLVADADVPRAVRWWLIALLAYLLMPLDLVPDFLPVIGFR